MVWQSVPVFDYSHKKEYKANVWWILTTLRIGVLEVGRQKSGGEGVRVSYNSVQLPRKAVCVYSENNTTLLEASFNNLISSLIRTYP